MAIISLSPKQGGFCFLKSLHKSKMLHQTLGQGTVQWYSKSSNGLNPDGITPQLVVSSRKEGVLLEILRVYIWTPLVSFLGRIHD